MLYVISYSVVLISMFFLAFESLYMSSFTKYKKSLRSEIFIGYDDKDRFINVFEYPHLLITGATQMGKTNLLKCMIYNLTQHKNVDIYMLSVRKTDYSEFKNKFKNLHVLSGLYEALEELKKLNRELIQRENDITKHVKYTKKKLKYIFIDEYSFLSVYSKNDKDKKVKEDIVMHLEEIAKIGASLGYYLVIATQRADSDVMKSQIKANCTAQITFKQVNVTNSQIAIGHGGAELLTKHKIIAITDAEKELCTPKFEIEL